MFVRVPCLARGGAPQTKIQSPAGIATVARCRNLIHTCRRSMPQAPPHEHFLDAHAPPAPDLLPVASAARKNSDNAAVPDVLDVHCVSAGRRRDLLVLQRWSVPEWWAKEVRQKLPARAVALASLGLALYACMSALSGDIFFPCRQTTGCSSWKRSSSIDGKTNQVAIATATASASLLQEPGTPTDSKALHDMPQPEAPTDLQHIVFAVASAASKWSKRQEYVNLWWQPPAGGAKRRGFVWLDQPLPSTINSSDTTSLPEARISESAAQFSYSWPGGNPSAVRVSRIVSETFRLGLRDVRWLVMGDDDTIFFPENLAKVLRKYDHRRFYYIGQSSESQKQSTLHSFGMAFGGGGVAVSFPLAEAMEKMQDDCLRRYPYVYGSDSRIEACTAELGVPLTRELGFHQIDLHGSIFGLLAAHPVAPLVSLHHVDGVEPIFPDRSTIESLRHLMKGALPDPAGLLQQSICYDMRRSVTLSVSWGYAVQVFAGMQAPLELQKPSVTFREWTTWRTNGELFTFGVRQIPPDSCKNPSVFFMESVRRTADGNNSVSTYRRKGRLGRGNCPHHLIQQETIVVYKARQEDSWFKAPRRQCCEVVTPKFSFTWPPLLTLQVRECKPHEIIAPPHK